MATNDQELLIARIFRKSMWPMVAGQFIMFLGSLVDGILISRFLGTESMAAFGLFQPLQLFIMIISQIFATGVQNTCGKAFGAGKPEEAKIFYSSAVAAVVALAGATMFMLLFCAGNVAEILGASGKSANLLPFLQDFLQGFSFAVVPMCLINLNVTTRFLEGDRKTVMYAVTTQLVVNVVGDLSNVFYFNGGMFGMGLATALCYLSSISVMMIRSRGGIITFTPKKISLMSLIPVIKIGMPSAFDRFYKAARTFVINKVLLSVGSGAAVAAMASVNTINFVFSPFIIGTTACLFTMTGIFFGEHDRNSMHRMLKFSLAEIFRLSCVITVVTFLAAPFIVRIFVAEEAGEEIFNMTVAALRTFVLYLPIHALNHSFQKYFHGINAMKMTYAVAAMDYFFYICICVVALGNIFGVSGVWHSFWLAEVLTLVSIAAIICFVKKDSPLKVESYLLLDKNFDADETNQIEHSAKNLNDIVAASEQVQNFCLSRGAKEREAIFVALTVEEMCRNILQWSNFDAARNVINIKIVHKDGWFIRIRDDTKAFDPKKWLAIHEDDDPLSNIGIRTICKLAKNIRYVSSLGMNNLIIKI